jgi:electron transfer flavoprotein beta subunit
MEVLVCVKRVPMVGGRIVVTADGQDVDSRMSGFTVSPHEECAVEEAVRLVERHGGTVTVLTLGPPAAADQLRDMLALGASRAVLLETDGREWGPIATADAIVAAVRARAGQEGAARDPGCPYDLLLFGNEAADTGDYQVGVRVAHLLGLPCVTGIKNLEVTMPAQGAGNGDAAESATRAGGAAGAGRAAGAGGVGAGAAGASARARREYRGTEEIFDIPLPAVISVKEGINLPRYPSLPGRLRAKRAAIEQSAPEWRPEGLRKERLRVPPGETKRAEVLGTGTDAVPALVALLDELGVLS